VVSLRQKEILVEMVMVEFLFVVAVVEEPELQVILPQVHHLDQEVMEVLLQLQVFQLQEQGVVQGDPIIKEVVQVVQAVQEVEEMLDNLDNQEHQIQVRAEEVVETIQTLLLQGVVEDQVLLF
jgi:hypothetical protein